MHPTVGDLSHPVKLGAKFPFSWPGLNHSWAPFFFFLLGCFSAVLHRTLHHTFQALVSFDKNLVLHIPANVPGDVAVANTIILHWHSTFLGLWYMQPMVYAASALLTILIWFYDSDASKDHFSRAACSSAPHTLTLHHCISTGKNTTTEHCNPWCLKALIFSFGKKREN